MMREIAERSGRTAAQILWPIYGDHNDANDTFGLEINASALPLATIAKLLGNSVEIVTLLDSAQFYQRRLYFRGSTSTSIRVSVSDNPETMPEMNLSNYNAHALLDALFDGATEIETCGSTSISDLRSKLSSRAVIDRITKNGLTKYLPTLILFSQFDRDPDGSRVHWA